MDLKEKRKITSNMLNDLGKQHENGGFNEFSQFTEETLHALIKKLNNSQLEWLLSEIESTSYPQMDRNDYINKIRR